MSKMPAVTEKTFGFGMAGLKKYPELLPIVSILGVACLGAAAFTGYSLLKKSDVEMRLVGGAIPRFERVDPTKSQKFMSPKGTKFQAIPELEALKKEIGSYKC